MVRFEPEVPTDSSPDDLQLPDRNGMYDPAADCAVLPMKASDLIDILRRDDVNRMAADYAAADAQANAAQASFTATHRWEVNAATSAAIIGAIFLSPLGDQLSVPVRTATLLAQYAALAIALSLGLWASRLGALDTWREARYAAEDLRTGLFRAILQPGAPGALPSQLAYFVERLFLPQLDYFKDKTARHRASLGATSMWNWFGTAMLAVVAVIVVLSLIPLAQAWGIPVGVWLSQAAMAAKPLDHPRVLLALGVVASTLQNVATMRAQVSLSSRNTERFAMLADRFKHWAETDLPRARTAAILGDAEGVNLFTDQVMREMDAEARAWRDVRGAVRPLSKLPWRKSR